VDALALAVAAAGGAGLADEVLLRVAGHLRGRPRLHRPARDVPPVAAPVLLKPLQKQPAKIERERDKGPVGQRSASGVERYSEGSRTTSEKRRHVE
jgi:hypothetical protein